LRCIQLFGLPGSGKSIIVNNLFSSDGCVLANNRKYKVRSYKNNLLFDGRKNTNKITDIKIDKENISREKFDDLIDIIYKLDSNLKNRDQKKSQKSIRFAEMWFEILCQSLNLGKAIIEKETYNYENLFFHEGFMQIVFTEILLKYNINDNSIIKKTLFRIPDLDVVILIDVHPNRCKKRRNAQSHRTKFLDITNLEAGKIKNYVCHQLKVMDNVEFYKIYNNKNDDGKYAANKLKKILDNI